MKISSQQMVDNPNLLDAYLFTKMRLYDPVEPHDGRMYLMPHMFGPDHPELWSPSEDASITQELMEKHSIGVEHIPHRKLWASYRPDGHFYQEAPTRLKAQLLCLASFLSVLDENGEEDEDLVRGKYEIPNALYHGLTKEN